MSGNGTQSEILYPIDIHRFPFDEHNCTILVTSWAHAPAQLNITLQKNSADVSTFCLLLLMEGHLSLQQRDVFSEIIKRNNPCLFKMTIN